VISGCCVTAWQWSRYPNTTKNGENLPAAPRAHREVVGAQINATQRNDEHQTTGDIATHAGAAAPTAPLAARPRWRLSSCGRLGRCRVCCTATRRNMTGQGPAGVSLSTLEMRLEPATLHSDTAASHYPAHRRNSIWRRCQNVGRYHGTSRKTRCASSKCLGDTRLNCLLEVGRRPSQRGAAFPAGRATRRRRSPRPSSSCPGA
jgi:hypothetical protein